MTVYTFKVNGITVTADPGAVRVSDSLLYAALGAAAILSFQQARPVTVEANGRPCREVSVTIIR